MYQHNEFPPISLSQYGKTNVTYNMRYNSYTRNDNWYGVDYIYNEEKFDSFFDMNIEKEIRLSVHPKYVKKTYNNNILNMDFKFDKREIVHKR